MNIKESAKKLLRPAYRKFLIYKNSGSAVKCNICGRGYKQFRPFFLRFSDGSMSELKDHGVCWSCNSFPRMRQLYYWLINDFDIGNREGLKILHIAPEVQLLDKLRNVGNISYTCMDKYCDGYDYPGYVVHGDVCEMGYEDSSFDMVICNHVLEHIMDDRKAMREIYRVLADNGIAILMVPMKRNSAMFTIEQGKDEKLSDSEREQRFGQRDHVRLYGLDYFDRLSEVGFSVERLTYNEELTAKYGFRHGEELIICRK